MSCSIDIYNIGIADLYDIRCLYFDESNTRMD